MIFHKGKYILPLFSFCITVGVLLIALIVVAKTDVKLFEANGRFVVDSLAVCMLDV